MKGEIPELKRCCICIPLRYGLLVWGYFKMTADAFLITAITYSMLQQVMRMRVHSIDENLQDRIYEDMIIPVIAVAVFFVDFMATILFIVGGHKKNVKLIRIFYYLSLGMWTFSLLYTALSVSCTIEDLLIGDIFWFSALLRFSFCFVVLVIQSYFLILLRSEIIKLKNNGNFRFVNNETGAECTMKYDEIVI